MKVLLVKPHNLSDHIQPSLGLGYLAESVRGHADVKILDCIKERVNADGLAKIVNSYKPDVLGLQCYTFDLKFVGDALRLAKSVKKDIVTVIGGPHPSALPEETMTLFKNTLDLLFVGEAEGGFRQLLGVRPPKLRRGQQRLAGRLFAGRVRRFRVHPPGHKSPEQK